ncbi:hypothetical protein CLAIMM_04059 isoform 2 [Cladophialophora immunda]|nr:hypothetical protein CLAIMM_04059 isoform 2 [Cladophialophora immunda]
MGGWTEPRIAHQTCTSFSTVLWGMGSRMEEISPNQNYHRSLRNALYALVSTPAHLNNCAGRVFFGLSNHEVFVAILPAAPQIELQCHPCAEEEKEGGSTTQPLCGSSSKSIKGDNC